MHLVTALTAAIDALVEWYKAPVVVIGFEARKPVPLDV